MREIRTVFGEPKAGSYAVVVFDREQAVFLNYEFSRIGSWYRRNNRWRYSSTDVYVYILRLSDPTLKQKLQSLELRAFWAHPDTPADILELLQTRTNRKGL